MGMTREETIKANDELRSQFKGGRVLMTPAVRDRCDPQLRGRMLWRLSLYNRFDDESDHSEGVFIFGGFSFYFHIEPPTDTAPRTLTVYLDADLLLSARGATDATTERRKE